MTDRAPPRSAAGTIAVAVVALSVFLMALRPLRSPDVWHHLKSGWFVVQNRGPASVDVFSCTAQGRPWIQYEWLAQLTLYGVWAAAGATGLVLLKAVLASIAALLLVGAIRVRRRAGWAAAALAVALAFCAASPRFFARPEAFTWVLFAGWMLSVEKIRAGRPSAAGGAGFFTPSILLPAALMVPWVNLHGAWPAGLAWLGLVCAGEAALLRLRPASALPARTVLRLWAALGLALAATLVNPYGVHIWEVPFKLSGSPEIRQVIEEWKRPGWAHWLDPRHVGAWIFLAAFLAAPLRIALSDWLVVLAFGALALSARRHLAMALVAVAPIAAAQFSLLARRGSERLDSWLHAHSRARRSRLLDSAPLNLAAVTAVCLALVFAALGGFDLKLAGLGLDRRVIPEGAAAFLRANRLDGNLFNSYNYGNYLLWSRYPDNRVFIDGRVDVYGPTVLRLYSAVRNAAPEWQKILAHYSVDLCVLATEKSTESRLLDALRRSPDWALVYWDDLSAVYVRRDAAREAFLRSAYVYSVRPDDFDSSVLKTPERLARAEADYRMALRQVPPAAGCALAEYGLARCLIRRGETAEAAACLVRAVALQPQNGLFYATLGAALLEAGKLDEAELRLRAALDRYRRAPGEFDIIGAVRWNLSLLYEREGRLEPALAEAKEALRLLPDLPSGADRVARLQRELAEKQAAR